MLREVDRRKRLAAEARVDTLPSKWDIPARERARFHWQKYCDMDIHGKRSKEGHRCLLLSDYDFQREIQTRKALYGYVKYSQRMCYWEAMEEDAYSPLKVAKFCSDMYSGIQFLPDHRSYPRGLFTETQWNSVAKSPLQRSVRKYYIPKNPPIPVLNKLWRGAPLKFDPYGLIRVSNPRLWRMLVNKAAPLVTFTYRNRRISPSEVAQNPVNPIMTDRRDVPSVQATDDNVVNDSNKVSELIIYNEGENYNNPEYELTDDYRALIERTFDYWNRNLSFYKLPFSYKQRWFNVEMQSGREVVEPRTLANIPVPMMRELGEETGLYVPDYIIFYYYEQYSHLHENRKVVLNGDCTLLIRDCLLYTSPSPRDS